MPRVSKKTFIKVAAISISLGTFIAIYPIISPFIKIPIFPALPQDVYIIIGMIIVMFPSGILHLLNVTWRRAIDRNIPKLLRQIAEAGRIGISIPRALALASEQDLGPLTDELRKVVNRVTWGYPIEKAIFDLIEDIGTPTARRAFTLILEAMKSGGNVEEMFMTLYRHLTGMQLTYRERTAMMRPYISYGYIAFFVFLAIQVILLTSFIGPILDIQSRIEATGETPIFRFAIDRQTIETYFYHISIIEAIISGLVSGKMGEGSLFAGLKHIVVLLTAAVLTYYLIL